MSDSNSGLHVYKPERELHYEGEVGQMIDYEKGLTDPDERPAYTIVVPEKEVPKHKRWFGDSAKDRNRTVRAVSTKPHGDGFAEIEFVLRPATKTETAKTETTAAKNGGKSDATPEVTDTATSDAAA